MTNEERIKTVVNDIDTALMRLYKAKCRTVSPVTQILELAQQQLDEARETVLQALIKV